MTERVERFDELRVYKAAMAGAMRLFELSRAFPREERYSLTDQVRRASRSVCANLAEAWQKRRYPAHFVSKLNDAASEAQETLVWIEFAERCEYLVPTDAELLRDRYDMIIGQLVKMMAKPSDWTIP